MRIEFDPAKDEANLAKHGRSLADGRIVFADPRHLVAPTVRVQDGEARSKVVGLIGDRLHTAIYVVRGEAVRFISVRKSNDSETRAYTSRS